MIPRFKAHLCILFFSVFILKNVTAQISEGGIPVSWQETYRASVPSIASTISYSGLDMKKIKAEDLANNQTVRFAAPMDVSIDPTVAGTWTTLPDGRQIWRATIEVEAALGLYVVFENFKLPKGGKLFGYNAENKELLGAYSDRNNKPHGEFMLGMITGSQLTLEYIQFADIENQTPFKISKLYVAYNDDHIQPSDYPFKTYDGFGDAMSCHININCPQGDDWQDHKRAVVRMLRVFEEGVGWCTGTLINNTNMDGKPYLLSAYHCIAGATPNLNLWRFDFNYEFAGCPGQSTEPVRYSMLGCQYRSGREESDFLLLELEDVIPQAYNAYFVGWNRDGNHTPDEMTGIHHPRGDVKKISTSNQPISIFNNSIIWSNNVTTPPSHHFRIELTEGTIEDGSSGSALFDEDGLITGQLHGGNAGCVGSNTTYYGRFSISWDAGTTPETRLRDWLDPNNTGQLSIGHFSYPTAELTGKVSFPNGTGIENVKLYVSGPAGIDSTFTDSNGDYSLTNLRQFEPVTLTASREGGGLNGVTLIDLVTVRSELLEQIDLTPDQQIAADVNGNGNVSLIDLVMIRQMLLFFIDDFPNGNWIFPNNDFQINMDANKTQNISIYKRGDVNFSADPGE